MGVVRGFRHCLALCRIGVHLARHDALFLLDQVPFGSLLLGGVRRVIPPERAVRSLRPGERLALALQGLGPSFIKLGQALSTRSDLIGEVMAEDLSRLQDRLAPFARDEAIGVIEAEFGKPIDQIFQRFDPTPVAAASVAQVHAAVTMDGRAVAVKILRPGVEAAFARDLDLMAWLADRAVALNPGLKRLRPVEVVRELADCVRYELDLRLEAAAASELRENFKDDPDFRVPAVDWDRTGHRVLTTEWVTGISVDEKAALIAAGHDLRAIVTKAAAAFFTMVLRDGYFHADLHPGNLFVAPDGAIVAVDFGIMGRLDRRHRYYLADMLVGFLTGDYRKVAQVHFDAGIVPASQSIDGFTQACRSIGEPLQGKSLDEISVARLLAQLFQITRQFKMETQPQLLMLQKTLVLAEGLGRHLDPDVNMWVLARPLIEDWMLRYRSPPARLLEGVEDVVAGLDRLPDLVTDLEAALRRLAQGGLSLHPDTVKTLSGSGGNGLIWPLWLAAIALTLLAFGRL